MTQAFADEMGGLHNVLYEHFVITFIRWYGMNGMGREGERTGGQRGNFNSSAIKSLEFKGYFPDNKTDSLDPDQRKGRGQ